MKNISCVWFTGRPSQAGYHIQRVQPSLTSSTHKSQCRVKYFVIQRLGIVTSGKWNTGSIYIVFHLPEITIFQFCSNFKQGVQ